MLACELLLTLYIYVLGPRFKSDYEWFSVAALGLFFNLLFGLSAYHYFEFKGTFGAFTITLSVTVYMAIKIFVFHICLKGQFFEKIGF